MFALNHWWAYQKNVWEVCGQILLIYHLFVIQTHYLLTYTHEWTSIISVKDKKRKNKKKMPPPFLQDLKCTQPNLFRESLKESTLAFSVQNS